MNANTEIETSDYEVMARVGKSDVQVGEVELTDDQYRHYVKMADTPEGWIRLGALPHDYYELDAEYQGLGEDTRVYIRPA